MLDGNVRPSTIEGVKRLAAQYRKQQGIKHHAALDLAAQAADCTNYRHALRTLSVRRTGREQAYVLLTIYWCDKEKRHQIGRETLKIELSKPILEICSRTKLKHVRGFGNLRMVAPDHFVCDGVAASQAYAREGLLAAERSLRFIEHTGLRPSTDHRQSHPGGKVGDTLPNRDHATDWVDSVAGQYILIDEPYSGVPNEAKRAAWAERTGWSVVKTSWPGMYYPHSCDLYVVTDGRAGYSVDALVATINAMPHPSLEKDWNGESSASWETFISPLAKTPQDIRRARSRGTIYPLASKTTLPYSYDMGCSRRRPAAAMPVERHIEAGSLIKGVLRSSQCPHGAVHRLNSVRSTLEDWMGSEVGRRQLTGPEFFDVYYNETENDILNKGRAQTRVGIVIMLNELKQMLQDAYPDCAPLRKQIHKIDMAALLAV